MFVLVHSKTETHFHRCQPNTKIWSWTVAMMRLSSCRRHRAIIIFDGTIDGLMLYTRNMEKLNEWIKDENNMYKYFENSQMNIQGSTTKGYSGRCHVFEFKAKVRPKKPALRLQGFALVAEHFRRKIGKWLFLRNLQARINRQKLHKESCSSYDFNTRPCASMQVKYNSSHKNRSTTARSKSLPGYPWNPEMLHQVKASKQNTCKPQL